MNRSSVSNKPEICRLCLSFTKTCFSLIEDSSAAGMLEALTSLKILSSDEISTVMCLKCCLNLRLAFNIQQKMLKAEQRFRGHPLSVPIKHESDVENIQSDTVELSCDISDKTMPSEESLAKHKSGVHVQVESQLCEKTFKKGTIKRHMDEVHKIELAPIESEKCDICGVEKPTKKKLDLHKYAVHAVLKCPICNEKFSKSQLKEHIVEHDISNLETAEIVKNALEDHTCDICGKKYPSKRMLNHHNYGVHLTEKCPICNKELKKCHLNQHIARHDDQNAPTKQYPCDICGKKKSSQIDLRKHKYNVHLKAECPICKKTISQTNIKRHIQRHDDPLTMCELCGVSVLQQDLRVHMYNAHTVRKLKCNFCDKIFKKNCDRTMHEKKDHLGQADFTCDTCGKRFFKNVYLKKHIEGTHLKMRPHICEFCNVGFSSRFALKTHRRQHTNERPFKCEFCGEGFRQNVSLKSHLKSQHDVEEELNCECKECGKRFGSSAALISHGRIH